MVEVKPSKWAVYNLQFPSGCRELVVHGYRFIATETYTEDIQKLSHGVSMISSDVRWERNTGEHMITASVNMPVEEEPAVIAWDRTDSTAFNDILLLLSLFTGRELVAIDDLARDKVVLGTDPRQFPWNAILRCSAPYKAKKLSEHNVVDIGFEETLNQVYQGIRTAEWQKQFGNGFYLLLAKVAFQQRTLEAAFIHCWTIWEHLFALLNQSWLSDESIRRLESAEKIAYVLIKFGILPTIGKNESARIKDLVQVRNRLIHFGMLPVRDTVQDDAELFVRLTEYLITKTLGLEPSDVLSTMGRLEQYLKRQGK